MTDDEAPVTPRLRRRLFGGYDRGDVRAALDAAAAALELAGREVDAQRQLAGSVQRQLAEALAELDAYRAREAGIAATLARAEELLERVEQATRDRPGQQSPGAAPDDA